jgi:hypothetical protein
MNQRKTSRILLADTRKIGISAVALLSTLSMAGCGNAEPAAETAERQEAIGPLAVDELGRPLDPVTGEPIDPYPLGHCTYICALSKRWVALTDSCKPNAKCDDLSATECTQEWDRLFGGTLRPRERRSACVFANLPPELAVPPR